jgi:hypothetical protein
VEPVGGARVFQCVWRWASFILGKEGSTLTIGSGLWVSTAKHAAVLT